MVTGRRDVKKFRENPRFGIRVEVSWKYKSGADGMPGLEDSRQMEVRNCCAPSLTETRLLF